MTGLAGYWPDERQIAECIKREAEAVSEAVLLAVHQTMPLSVRNAGSPNEQAADEKAFLDAFLAKDLPEGVLIQPVTGTSGAGKSHLIRWLYAQLQRDERAKNMVVVRIPKTASLRNVVERVLELLAKDTRFDKAKEDLRRAVEEVTLETASIRLAGGIEIALKELAKKVRAGLVADPNGPDAVELAVRLDHARRLPNYLNDPALEEHFKTKIFTRIIAGSVRAERGQEVDATERQFSADDLKPPPGIRLDGSASTVQSYYTTILMARDGEGFGAAADILNEILDPAIGEVFRLSQALGGVTLQELILSIRELLLEDGKELVLLIEDFAALSGIQETLLSVCIQEAVRDGRLVRAPMRTAIAITDGYLKGRDTILTRAKRVWQVRTALGSTQDVFGNTTALVAAYLNAARWGSSALEDRFKASGGSEDLTSWVTPYVDENISSDDATLLDAFGFGPNNVPLFPYNEAAIRNLTIRHLSEGGQVLFKPRAIINFILRDVLEKRDFFLRGSFPPEKFEEAVPKAEISSWLSRAPAEIRGRLESTIVYWGDNPGTLSALAQVPEQVFEAFKLKTPRALGLAPNATPVRTSTPAPSRTVAARTPRTTAPAAEPTEDPDRRKWIDVLQAWVSGKRLPQGEARYLRTAVADLLQRSMNWTALRIARAAAPELFISIHNSQGDEAPAPYKLQLSKEPGDPDGRLRKGLLAIALYKKNERSWEYPDGDLDGAAAANLIDRLAKQYAADIEARAQEEIAWLVDQLMIQARVLGQTFRETNEPDRVANLILKSIEMNFADGLVPDSAEYQWQQLQRSAHRHRPELQKLLLARLGCFQGTGSTTYGIDMVRLGKALKSSLKKPPRECTTGELGTHIGLLREAFLRVRVQKVAQNLRDFAAAVVSSFGQDFNKEDYLREAKALVESVGSDIWPPNGEQKQALTAAIEEFRKTSLQETLEKIRRIPDGDLAAVPVMDLVSVAAQIDFSAIARTRNHITLLNQFMAGVEQQVAAKERTAGDADPAAQAVAIEEALDRIEAELNSLV